MFIIILQFFIDSAANFVSQFRKYHIFSITIVFIVDILFELMVRSCCFIVVSVIFVLMDFDEGLNRSQLKALLLVWLMSAIHCGAVAVWPIHTLFVLSITVTPILDMLLK